jgi:hypothetical protein
LVAIWRMNAYGGCIVGPLSLGADDRETG